MIEVALFPIPNLVAFPGTIVPLHVFEPRYRRLVHDCVEDQRMVGVSHVRKTIREAKRNQSLEEALSTNQSSYQPREVFSAGHCRIVQTTPDGRIMAEITMEDRLTLIEERQSVPYRIVSCEPVEDEAPAVASDHDGELQRSIDRKLVELIRRQNPDMTQRLEDPAWTSLTPGEHSFRIFQFLRFDADVMQDILESRSPSARLQMIWDVLRLT